MPRTRVEERNWEMAWLHIDGFWDNIRSDPRFRSLQLQLGLPFTWGSAVAPAERR